MGMGFGRTVLSPQTGNGLQALANLQDVDWKPGGITIDWSTVTAVSGSPVTLLDNLIVAVGQKYLRYGTVLARITSGANSGMYGPVDTAATDGRQTQTQSQIWVLNQTILENGLIPELGAGSATNYTGAFNGGTVWAARLLVGGTGQLTLAQFRTTFGNIILVEN